MSVCLKLDNLSCGYTESVVLKDISFEVEHGQVCCVLGPNGIGKTTLFKTILRSIPALGGTIYLEGNDICTLTRSQLARRVGYVPQAHTPPFPFTVLDIVEMGRASHISTFSSPSKEDTMIALEALNMLGIVHLKDRIYTEISGGERQMVLIARALAQQASFVIMDEPTASLDYGNQVKVLEFVKRLARAGISVLMTTHSPEQVFMCADIVVAIKGGGDFCVGAPHEVITEELLQELYDIKTQLVNVQAGDMSMPAIVPDMSFEDELRDKAIDSYFERLK